MTEIFLNKTIKGTILDLGGGGEGIIGRIYKSQVTAIDNRQDELDEAPQGFTKLLMDAGKLEFDDYTFDNVTSFYTFMYIEKDYHSKVIQEAHRVLKKGGNLYIWDTNIGEADPFIVQLKINANGTPVNTTYGVYKDNAVQNGGYFQSLGQKIGFNLVSNIDYNNQFYLHFRKQ